MKHRRTAGFWFRRSPIVRFFLWVVLVVGVLVFSIFWGQSIAKKPVITLVSPPVGSPGDVVVITGDNFGSSRATSFVEIAGSRITGSGYIEWDDAQIRLILPSNVQDGLVYVETAAGRSNAGFFANEATIPIAVRSDPRATLPSIDAVAPDTAAIGETVTITGTNFGSMRGKALVYFTASRDALLPMEDKQYEELAGYIPANEADFDYEYWTDTEVRVRVPDGAATGQLFVQTDKGNSEYQAFTVRHPSGQKSYTTPRTYVLRLDTDIQPQGMGETASITLYIPRPALSSIQPVAALNAATPEPLIRDDRTDIIYHMPLGTEKQKFSQEFIVGVYAAASGFNHRSTTTYSAHTKMLYAAWLAADKCVPADAEEIVTLAQTLTAGTNTPYGKAQLLYAHLADSYRPLHEQRTGLADPLALLAQKSGDAYDFAIVYAALCRASGIPALPVGGILVGTDSRPTSHWWVEIYFEQYGWFPVDAALGAGMEYQAFTPVESPRTYYFGNLDNQHIAFSRGWKDIKPSLLNGTTVRRPRAYALQSIWEEASKTASSYSSLWNDPIIIGIY